MRSPQLFSFSKRHSASVYRLIKKCFEEQLSNTYSKKVVDRFIATNSPAMLREEMKKQKMLIARVGRKIIGFMSFAPHSKYIRLFKLFVDVAYQRKKVGTVLLRYLRKYQKPILVESAIYRPAVDFYLKNGFVLISESSKEIGKGLRCRVALMKHYPVNNLVKIGIRHGKNTDYLCIGDVLYALKKWRPNAFSAKLKKKHFALFEEREAMVLLEKLKKAGCVEPLAEYPFYDLVVFNAKHRP